VTATITTVDFIAIYAARETNIACCRENREGVVKMTLRL
jgi:hypothetical protein